MSAAPASPLPPSVQTGSTDREICAICGRDSGSATFCHLYRAGRRLALCSPGCVHSFLLADPGPAGTDPAANAWPSSRPAWFLDPPPATR